MPFPAEVLLKCGCKIEGFKRTEERNQESLYVATYCEEHNDRFGVMMDAWARELMASERW